MTNGLLAPSKKQRLRYAHWLQVYAKETTPVTSRMSDLLTSYKVKNKVLTLKLFSNHSNIYRMLFRDTVNSMDHGIETQFRSGLTSLNRALSSLPLKKLIQS